MTPDPPLDVLEIVSQSPAMREVLSQIDKAAASSACVTLAGEPGTGRGLVARAIHARAHGNGAPFVAVDCSAFLPAEAEGRLFGAPADREGGNRSPSGLEIVYPGALLLGALGGTLCFRHVEELPTRVQVRLATLFRDREYQTRPLGEAQSFTARPIAVVQPDFPSQVNDGRVRPDLYRRFAEFQIQLPALRDRREDIPALAQCFVTQACRRSGAVEDKTLDAAAKAVLAALPWHGNAGELKALLETLVRVTAEKDISLQALLDHVSLEAPAGVYPSLGASLREARKRFEREYIAAVVAQHHGRIPDAAKTLGVQRTNLYRKLRALRLPRPLESWPPGPAKGASR